MRHKVIHLTLYWSLICENFYPWNNIPILAKLKFSAWEHWTQTKSYSYYIEIFDENIYKPPN